MKTIKINHKLLPVLLLVISGIAIMGLNNSCEKDNQGPPEITKVRPVNPDEADVELEGSGLNQWIVIQGKNLATAQHIYFNDYEAGFNPAFVSETNIVIQIPPETPNLGNTPDAPNTLRIVTNYGEVTFDFITFAPPPLIYSISNEFAAPGDTLFMTGDYFYFVDSVIFPGWIPAIEFWDSESGKYLVTIVPEGAVEPGPIRVVTGGGAGGSQRWTYFRDTVSTMKCNFDDINTFIWGCDLITDNGNFPGADGSFANISASGIAEDNVGWWDPGRSCNLDSSRWINSSQLSDAASDYMLKFELFVDEPWNTGILVVDLTVGWNYQYRIAPWIQGDERISYSSTGWVTVYMPFSEFRTENGTSQDRAASLGDIFWNNGFGRLAIMHMNSGDPISGLPSLFLDEFSVGIDNIRIVKLTE
jgi:hypothetical protein